MTGPHFDAAAVRAHAERHHRLARDLEGDIVVATYGEDPLATTDEGKLGRPIVPLVRRFAVGDVAGTVAAIMSQQDRWHANVYMPWTVLRPSNDRSSRGTEADIVAVLALVADMDADRGFALRTAPIAPSLIIESSPGNFQHVFIFDRPLAPIEAKPLARALQRATNADSGTADIAHVWRVPGTLNWPNAAKLKRGRPAEPTAVLDRGAAP